MKQTLTANSLQVPEVYSEYGYNIGLSSLSNLHESQQSPYEEAVCSICSAINQGADEERIPNAQKDFVTKVVCAVFLRDRLWKAKSATATTSTSCSARWALPIPSVRDW